MERTVAESAFLTLDFYKGKLERKQRMLNEIRDYYYTHGTANMSSVQEREWTILDAEVNLLREVVADLEIVCKGK